MLAGVATALAVTTRAATTAPSIELVLLLHAAFVLPPTGFVVSHVLRFSVLGRVPLLVTRVRLERRNLVIRPSTRITKSARLIPR